MYWNLLTKNKFQTFADAFHIADLTILFLKTKNSWEGSEFFKNEADKHS